MKILHVIPSVGPARGGPTVALRTLVRGLADAGTEVHVAATDDDGETRLHLPNCTPVENEGVSWWYFPRQTRFYTISLPLSRWLARHIVDYDIVHIHALFSFSTVA